MKYQLQLITHQSIHHHEPSIGFVAYPWPWRATSRISRSVGFPTSPSPLLNFAHKTNHFPSIYSQRLVQRKAQILPWIANPLHLFLHSEHKHGHHQPLATEEHKLPHTEASASRENIMYEEIEAEEAHPLELFYDLFFVANLTTITSVHVMTDYSSEQSSSPYSTKCEKYLT